MSDLYNPTPSQIVLYGVTWCGDCRRARRVLANLNTPYLDVDIDADPAAEAFVLQINNGNRSVPTLLFPDGTHLTEPGGEALRQKIASL
jgi:mycoredoxin